ncbi:MAG: DUF2149 domain-containing protein [Actinobacteria bacterium]|nr:DUF2149 domain-containing protein [Actinomycetota bacterium]
MPASDDHATIKTRGTVYGPRDDGLRYMRRRRIGTADRNGDPLDGLVNLFVVALVLAVGFLVAALSAAGLSGLLTSQNMTIVTDPGTPQMQVIVKEGGQIVKVDMASGSQIQGLGTLVGSFYKLADGTVIYVPAGALPPAAATPVPDASSTPGAPTTPAPTTTDYPTTNPYASPTPLPTAPPASQPTPGITLTPDSLTPLTGE